MKLTFAGLLCFCFLALSVTAQLHFEPSTAIAVHKADGSAMTSPWSGGINAAQISAIDVNGDGKQDLFVFDRSGNRILVFESYLENEQWLHRYNPQYQNHFPQSLEHWVLLRDVDCDGKQDIFTQSPLGGGIAVYRNISESAGQLQFELESNLLFTRFTFANSSPDSVNLYTSPTDIPGIVDMDGDGDLDLFTFSVTGTQMEYHENLSVDLTGQCGLGTFKGRNLCYGQFSEGSETNDVFLGNPCGFNVVNPRGADEGLRHVGTTILAQDFSDDGLVDFVLGGVTYTNATYLENSTGFNGVDSIVFADIQFPLSLGALPIDLDNFIAAFYEDLNGDGIKDMAVAVNEAFSAKNTESVWLYENSGTNTAPLFTYVKNNFLQEGTIDHGEVAVPAFADVNGDGLLDLVVGSRGEFMEGSTFRPSLSLYLNTGSSTSPSFQLEDGDWLQSSEIGFNQYLHPSFGDIDNDGDVDLVLGDLSGRVFLLLNIAGAGNAMSFELSGALSADDGVIDVGQQSTPQLYDLSGDGRLDLIIGERNGNINYYLNTSSNGTFHFTLVSDTLGGIDTVEPGFFIGNSAPHFFKYDGTTYLLIGVESGTLHLYSGIDGNEEGQYVPESLQAFGVDAGEKSRPSMVNLRGAEQPDLFCGSIGGGILYYRSEQPTSTNAADAENGQGTLVYPNPASAFIRVKLPQKWHDEFAYNIYHLSGKMVLSGQSNQNAAINVSALSAGTYVLEIGSGSVKHRTLLFIL